MKQVNPQQADIAYAAGFFDGEGSFATYIGGGKYRRSLIFVASCWQSSLPVLDWLAFTFGGGVYRRENAGYGKGSNKSAAEWRVNGYSAARFIEMILPYLKVRKDDAQIMLSIWTVREDRETLLEMLEIRKLNRAAATTERRDVVEEDDDTTVWTARMTQPAEVAEMTTRLNKIQV